MWGDRLRFKMRYLLLIAFVGLLGCDGSVGRIRYDASARQDVWNIPNDDSTGTPTADTIPGNPGDPCPNQECQKGLLCVAAQCRTVCTQPKLGCNHVAAVCAADQTCVNINSFSDACMPAPALEGKPCSRENQCKGGLLCLDLTGKDPLCRRLCSLGCPATDKCVESTRGCSVCVPK